MTAPQDSQLAQELSVIGDLGQGTLVSLVVKKRGVFRAGEVRGDDTVHVLIWTGFHHKALVQRSNAKLDEIWGSSSLLTNLLKETIAAGHPEATIEDAAEAVQELQESFRRVLNGKLQHDGHQMDGADVEPLYLPADDRDPAIMGGIKSNPVFEPLMVGGKVILGAKVYVGQGEPGNPRAPKPGTIYIDGVKLGEIVLLPSANGQWTPKSAPKTVAKNILRSLLPAGLYVRYILDRDGMVTCKIGKSASEHAKAANMPIDPEAIRTLFKIAV